MSELKLEFVGKPVKDMYGTLMGKVVGIITDTDGTIESISVDCGDTGLKPLIYEQLIVQGDFVIYIPKWRLDAQKLFRQKNLTLKRIKALRELVEEDDAMKADAELVYVKYEKKLQELEEKENSIREKLDQRLNELDESIKNIKSILFDSKLQYKSHEISDSTYKQVIVSTNELMDHINLEKEEINNIKIRLEEQNLDNTLPLPSTIQQQKIKPENPPTEEVKNITSPESNHETEHSSINEDNSKPLIETYNNSNDQTNSNSTDQNSTNNNSNNSKKREEIKNYHNIDSEEANWLDQVITKT
ncbi:MAG: CdvA-like protein [Nitrososphaeraceae archaeon]